MFRLFDMKCINFIEIQRLDVFNAANLSSLFTSFFTADIQDDPSSKPEIPFAEAKVKCCSAFAVICRLKSYTYSTPADDDRDFTCIVHEFPDVSVSIPASVVHENKEFQLTLKVYFPNYFLFK